jgi:hypothetical protein
MTTKKTSIALNKVLNNRVARTPIYEKNKKEFYERYIADDLAPVLQGVESGRIKIMLTNECHTFLMDLDIT